MIAVGGAFHIVQIFHVMYSTIREFIVYGHFQIVKILEGHKGSVMSVAFSSDSKYIASGSHDNTIRIWNVEKGKKCIRVLKGHEDSAMAYYIISFTHLLITLTTTYCSPCVSSIF